MLMTAVIQPESLDRDYFSILGYRDQAEMFFRGLESNGLILVDPDGRLLAELNSRVQALSTKDGQQIQIRLAELQKKQRRRIVFVDRTICACPQSLSPLHTALTVCQSCRPDTLIVDTKSQPQINAPQSASLTPLGSYISSDYEKRRHYYLDQTPPIDKMAAGEFDDDIVRCTRFSQIVRIYDKQIGHGSSLGGFRQGIGRILALWVANAHFPKSSLAAEIYTCVQKSREPVDVIYARIRDLLLHRLHREHGVRVTLFFKEDDASITHDRFLQTNSVALSFSKGFDYLNENGDLQRCSVKIDNGAYEHLQDYRNLKDHKPPAT